jgi:4-aminobutyrate aminotransferase/(S)-3-amino-2-methylpropionate transaminase
MEDIDLNGKAQLVGDIIKTRFEAMKAKHSEIGQVRGLGAMIAMEFVKDSDPTKPDPELCAKLVKACAKRNLIVISAGVHKSVLRTLCPLVISHELLNKGLDIIEEELDKILA